MQCYFLKRMGDFNLTSLEEENTKYIHNDSHLIT